MHAFVWQAGGIYIDEDLPADFSDTIYVPLLRDFPDGYTPILFMHSGWGYNGNILSGDHWKPCSACGPRLINGKKYVYGGFRTKEAIHKGSDMEYVIIAVKSNVDNLTWSNNILKKKELDAQGEE